jgi:uncharacterized protein
LIVADTGAVLALLDADDRHHAALLALWEEEPDGWILPWAILPEVDYLARRYLGARAARLFLADVASGAFTVEYGTSADTVRAAALDARHAALGAGLVDCVVVAIAERLNAGAIATLDERDFAVLAGAHRLYPRDLRP